MDIKNIERLEKLLEEYESLEKILEQSPKITDVELRIYCGEERVPLLEKPVDVDWIMKSAMKRGKELEELLQAINEKLGQIFCEE